MRVGRVYTRAPRIALAVAVAAIVAFGLASCQILGVTKMDRLSQFGADLNTNKSHMSANFAQGQTADYGIMDSQAYWDGKSFLLPLTTELTYSIVVHDYVDPAKVTADIYGPPLFNPNGVPIPAVLVLVQIGPDWFIKEIHVNGTPPQTIQ